MWGIGAIDEDNALLASLRPPGKLIWNWCYGISVKASCFPIFTFALPYVGVSGYPDLYEQESLNKGFLEMMLSNEDIKACIKQGQLCITPFNEKWLRGAGILMHLGGELLKPRGGYVVDVRKPAPPPYDAISITMEKPYALQPGEFVLGHTFQSVTVGPALGFLIEGRSTLARVGLTIVQTAMMVYPGHSDRPVTLELANHGPNTILLYPKMKIARVGLFELKTPSSVRYDEAGKYRGQQSAGIPIFVDEIMGDDEC